MSRTGAQLLTGLSTFMGDSFTGTTTSQGNSGATTLVDTSLRALGGDDAIRGMYLRPTGTSNKHEIRRITKFTSATGICTVAPAFTGQTASSEAYELHRYEPSGKFTALDEARMQVYPDLAQLIFNDTLTGDGVATAFDVPAVIVRGPVFALIEDPISAEPQWNFLQDPLGDSTSNFTVSNFTATTYSRTDSDLIVPKYNDNAMELVLAASTAGTQRQVVGSMINGITAAIAAGRQMTAAVWYYSRTADKTALEFLDDNGVVATSGQHGGAGWELLTATGTVAGDNATTLTWGLTADNDVNAIDDFWNRGWFYFGDAHRVRDVYSRDKPRRLQKDDTIQRVYFDYTPTRGRQIRLIGRDILSALGTSASTQVTNTMEIDEPESRILFAEAARIIYKRQGLNASDFPEVAQRMAVADGERRRIVNKWRMNLPGSARVKGAWV